MRSSGHTPRILVVDDSETDFELIVREVRKEVENVSFLRVDDPQDFFRALERDTWDLIVCDHFLPKHTSEEMFGILKNSRASDVPFLIWSGIIDADTEKEMLAQGVVACIGKEDNVQIGRTVARELKASLERTRPLNEVEEWDYDPGTERDEDFVPAQDSSRIMVVEDELWILDMVVKLLKSRGHSVTGFDDPYKARNHFVEGKFDVLIVDREMPGMRGDELAAFVKLFDNAPDVVMLTAYGETMNDIGQIPSGVDVVIAKPFKPKTIDECLARLRASKKRNSTPSESQA